MDTNRWDNRKSKDHVMIYKKWRRSLLDGRVKRIANVVSDHCIVMVLNKLKLTKQERKLDIDMNTLKNDI